jgi:hypothetical protein
MSASAIDYSLFAGSIEREADIPASLRARSTVDASASSSPSLSSSDDESGATTPDEELKDGKPAYKLAGEEWGPKVVNPPQDGTDFLWLLQEEPHRTRRRAIQKAHPEVRRPPLPLYDADNSPL